MHYTLTLNPAIDLVVATKNYTLGKVNSYADEKIFPGGKGINVSILLSRFNVSSLALGVCAGFTGREIIRLLENLGVATNFVVEENGFSRINIKQGEGETETELNGKGLEIQPKVLEKLFVKLESLKKGDVLVLAGSLPHFAPKNTYEVIGELVAKKGVKIVADTAELEPLLKFKPILVKPNKEELSAIFGVKINGAEDAEKYGRILFEKGSENVIVSLGEQGAVLINKFGSFYHSGVKGKAVSACGAGDSMLAAFLYGMVENGYPKNIDKNGYIDAFLWGAAAGSATAFTQGIASLKEITICKQKLLISSVEKIK